MSRGMFLLPNFYFEKSLWFKSYLVGGGELLPINSPLNSLMNTFLLIFPNLADPKVDFSLRKGFLKSTLLVLKLEPVKSSPFNELVL